MEQQQINNEFNPPYGELLHQDHQLNPKDLQRTQINAQKRLKQLAKSWPISFQLYEHYFNHSKLSHLTLHKGSPKFYLHSQLYDRRRLGLDRQGMYYRGAVDNFVTDDFLKEYIEESAQQKGFINKKGSKSVIHDDILYYAHESAVKAIQMPKLGQDNMLEIYQQTVQPMQIVDFQQQNFILQLKVLQNHYLNTVYEGLLLSVRFSRKIVIFSIKQRKIISTLSSSSQFININHSLYNKNTLQTVQYDGFSSILSTYQIQDIQLRKQIRLKDSFKIQDLINTRIDLNRNEILLTKYSGLYSFDRRSNKEHKLYEVKNPNLERMYSSIPLKGLYNFSPLITSCHSRYVSIFDIRKPNSFIKTYLHHCEESPPEILQFYDGSSQSYLSQPIITCHSPYSLGSSAFLPLDLDTFDELNIGQSLDFQYFKNPISVNHFKLLHDHGKSSKQTGLHRIFNESLSVWNPSADQFFVFKIDNQGTIDMQLFKHNEKNEKYQQREFHSQNQQIIQLNKSQSTLSELWLKSTNSNKFFIKETVYKQQVEVQTAQQRNQQKPKKKADKKKKSKNNQKIEKKNSSLKQPQTQVDMADFLEGEYQNSQECQESLTKRKVNYGDLSKFFSFLCEKATHPFPQLQSKKNQVDFSFSSTQPFSQSLTFSQSLENEVFSKSLSFDGKKLMDYQIKENLKNEWDN